MDETTRAQTVTNFKAALIAELNRRSIPFAEVKAFDFSGVNLDLWIYPEGDAMSAIFSYTSWGWLEKCLRVEPLDDIVTDYADRYFRDILDRYEHELEERQREANDKNAWEHHREASRKRLPIVRDLVDRLHKVNP